MEFDFLDLEKTIVALSKKLQGWLQDFVVMLPNLVVAVVVVIAFSLIARYGSRLFSKLLAKMSSNRQVNGLLTSTCYCALILCGVFIALGVLQLDKTVTSLLAGVGILGLALGFAFQDLAANFMAGVLISIRRPFKIGEIVASNGFMGSIKETSLRATQLQTFDGQMVLIPNKDVFGSPLVNYSSLGKRRVDIEVGVSYADELEKARAVSIKAISELDFADSDKEVEVFFGEFGGSSINFTVRFWIDFSSQKEFLQAKSEGIIALKNAFDREGLTIPYPIRTLDFGISGGVSLSEQLTAPSLDN